MKYVFRRNGDRNEPTVKHGDGSITLWGCFSAAGVGSLHRIKGIMKKEDNAEILSTYVKHDARKVRLGRRWLFQHDRDPKQICIG